MLVGAVASLLLMAPMVGWASAAVPEALRNAWVRLAIALSAQLYVGAPFLRGALAALRRRSADMDTLVSLGSTAALLGSAAFELVPALASAAHHAHAVTYDAGLMVLTLVALGRLLEDRAKGRAGAAVRGLLDLAPRTARVVVGDAETEVPAEDLLVGDRVRVRPGERVPADGLLVEGASAVDESAWTGESIPRDKAIGDEVLGGSVNRTGAFVMRVERAGEATTLAQVARLVRDAQARKAPIQALADRVSAVFVPVVLAVATLAGIAWLVLRGRPRPRRGAHGLRVGARRGVPVRARARDAHGDPRRHRARRRARDPRPRRPRPREGVPHHDGPVRQDGHPDRGPPHGRHRRGARRGRDRPARGRRRRRARERAPGRRRHRASRRGRRPPRARRRPLRGRARSRRPRDRPRPRRLAARDPRRLGRVARCRRHRRRAA